MIYELLNTENLLLAAIIAAGFTGNFLFRNLSDDSLYWIDKLTVDTLKDIRSTLKFLTGKRIVLIDSLLDYFIYRVQERDILLGTHNEIFKRGSDAITILSVVLSNFSFVLFCSLFLGSVVLVSDLIISLLPLESTTLDSDLNNKRMVNYTLLNLCVKDCLVNNLEGFQTQENVSKIYYDCLTTCAGFVSTNYLRTSIRKHSSISTTERNSGIYTIQN